MPFRQHGDDHMLHAMSHMMNCVSIEIKLAASHGQTTRFYLLCDTLLAVNGETQRLVPLEINNSLLTPPDYFNATDVLPGRILLPKISSGLHVNRLIDSLELHTITLNHPSLSFFDEILIAKLLVDCEAKTSVGGAGMINVHKLYDILHDELRHVQSTIASGQRKEIVQEITVLLQYAIQLNCVRMQRFAIYNFMNAWCRLVQVLFSIMPESMLPVSVRKQHIIDIIEKILMKVEPQQPLIKISILVTETVLLLLANLRSCFYQLEDERALDEHGNMICLSDVNVGGQNVGEWGLSGAGGNGNGSNLRFILKRLIDWIMTSEVKSQKLSINIYGALLNCLRILKRVRSEEQLEYNDT